MLLNLEYSLKCDAFIGTLESNWCRLVDEMRCTVGTYVHACTSEVQCLHMCCSTCSIFFVLFHFTLLLLPLISIPPMLHCNDHSIVHVI